MLLNYYITPLIMKSLSSFIFFLPVIVYLIFLVTNLWLLGETQTVRIPFVFSDEIQVVLMISLFFILYIIWLWLTFKFSNFFSSVQKWKLGTQVNDLKAELHDKQWDLINSIRNDFETNLWAYKVEAEKDRKIYKTETDKILNNLQFEITQLSEKIVEFKKEK